MLKERAWREAGYEVLRFSDRQIAAAIQVIAARAGCAAGPRNSNKAPVEG